MERAIRYGFTGIPDPRADIAEFLLRSDRKAEADALFAKLRAEYPDDIWLYNNAALAYQGAGDHETALAWLTEGLELALSSGDPEDLADQLSEMRRESLADLGRPLDDLERRVDAFLQQPPAVPATPSGQERGESRVPAPERPKDLSPQRAAGTAALAIAWFAPAELEAALARWPDWYEVPEKRDYDAHRRAVQTALMRCARAGTKASLAPIGLQEYADWAEAEDRDPTASATVAAFASCLVAQGRIESRILAPRTQPPLCTAGARSGQGALAERAVRALPDTSETYRLCRIHLLGGSTQHIMVV